MSENVKVCPVEQIQKHAETARNERRNIKSMSPGQGVRQGDVYLFFMDANHPRGKEIGKGSVQVAVGNSTGSRHIATGTGIKVYEGREVPSFYTGLRDTDDCLGPVVESESAWTLTHPEHADIEFPAGTYQVTYQLDARTQRRVAD